MSVRLLWVAGALLAIAAPAWGHAFPDRSDPPVGRMVDASPPAVRVWFDGAIDPSVSTLRVEDAAKRRVDKNDSRVSASDDRLLEISVPPLPPGRYRVFWSVVDRAGHRTDGSFAFRVK